MKTFFFTTALMAASSVFAAKKVEITVQNPLGFARSFEVVEVPMKTISMVMGEDDFIITDADGRELPLQVTSKNTVLFQTSVGGRKTSTYYAVKGTPKMTECKVMGRLFTERQDEFGWENDRVAYRIYGHGAAVGYDVFNKSTSALMLDYWYASEQDQEMRSVAKKLRDRGQTDLADQLYNAFSYHIDHGQGMDCYTVGPTLGAGANALMNDDKTLCMPQCYKSYEILEDGLLRFSVRFTYPDVDFKGRKIYETRTITIDAGSSFCRVDVRYMLLKAGVSATMASGVVIHKSNPTAFVLNKEAAYLGYEDLGDASVYNERYRAELAKQMGKIYVGTVYPQPVTDIIYEEGRTGIANGHLLALSRIWPYEDYTYYFGSAWSRNNETNIHSLRDWEAALSREAKIVRNPLKVSVKVK